MFFSPIPDDPRHDERQKGQTRILESELILFKGSLRQGSIVKHSLSSIFHSHSRVVLFLLLFCT